MDLRTQRIKFMTSLYESKCSNDLKWDEFKKNVIPSIVDSICYYCKKSFSCEFSLKRHLFTIHLELLPTSLKDQNLSQDLNCSLCKKNFSRRDKLNDHLSNSIQHKQAVLSIKNTRGTIQELFSTKKQNKRSYTTTKNNEEEIDAGRNSSKRIKTNEMAEQVPNKRMSNEHISDEDEVVVLSDKDPYTESLENFSKEDLLNLKNNLKTSLNDLFIKYKKVKKMLEKHE